MEAARILKTLYVKPQRTIGVVLGIGEEQGLFGSHDELVPRFTRDAMPPLPKPCE